MKDNIQKLINQSRKERSAYQSVMASVQEREARENINLDDNQILNVIEKEKKAFEESYDLFKDKKPEEAKLFNLKAEYLNKLLPEKIDETQYDDIADKIITESKAKEMKDMGKVMGAITKEYGKSVDMKKMSGIVKEKLKELSYG